MSETKVEKAPPKMDQVKSFLAGGAAGVSAVLVGHPFDTLKVRLQTSNEYKGLFDCFQKTIAKDGVRGLYRGMVSPLLRNIALRIPSLRAQVSILEGRYIVCSKL